MVAIYLVLLEYRNGLGTIYLLLLEYRKGWLLYIYCWWSTETGGYYITTVGGVQKGVVADKCPCCVLAVLQRVWGRGADEGSVVLQEEDGCAGGWRVLQHPHQALGHSGVQHRPLRGVGSLPVGRGTCRTASSSQLFVERYLPCFVAKSSTNVCVLSLIHI